MSLNPGCYYIKIHSHSGFSDEQNYMVSVYKENALTLSMPYIRANAGDAISVPVAIQNLPTEGLCAFDFLLDYDSTMLNYLDYTVDYSDPSWALVDTEQVIEVNKESDGVIRVLFLDNSTTFTKPLNKEGIIIKLNFQVNTEATDGVYDISCGYGSFAKSIGDTVLGVSHAIFKNGLIMIGSYGLTGLQFDVHIQNLISMASNGMPVADVNGDGSVNSLDFASYRMYLLGFSISTFDTTAADVNEDGIINSLDFGVLRRLLLQGVYGCWVMMYKDGKSIVVHDTTIPMRLREGWSLSSGGGTAKVYALASTDTTRLSDEQQKANAEYIYDYLSKQGWTKEAICGLNGNVEHESHFNPGVWQNWHKTTSGNAYGIVQWDPASKVLNSIGVDENSADDMARNNPQRLMELQLEYLIKTCQPGQGEWLSGSSFTQKHYNRMPLQYGTPSQMSFQQFTSSTSNPGDLALVFNATYERSNDYAEKDGVARLQQRYDNANKWYNYFKNR